MKRPFGMDPNGLVELLGVTPWSGTQQIATNPICWVTIERVFTAQGTDTWGIAYTDDPTRARQEETNYWLHAGHYPLAALLQRIVAAGFDPSDFPIEGAT